MRIKQAGPAAVALVVREAGGDYDVQAVIGEMEAEMLAAADAMEFERAALLRDQIAELRSAAGLEPRTTGRSARGRQPGARKKSPLKYPGVRHVRRRRK